MTSLQHHAQELLDRLDKEVARQDAGHTVKAGGVTMMGNALEALLMVAVTQTLGADATSRSRLRERHLIPGAGTYSRLLQPVETRSSADPLLRAILEENKRRPSMIARAIDLRNANGHPGESADSPVDCMRRLAKWLRPLLR